MRGDARRVRRVPRRGVLLSPLGFRRRDELAPELRAELEGGLTWTYEWQLRNGATTPVHRSFLPQVSSAVAALIEPSARAVLADAGPSASALDIACNEGWFAHRLLDWGAERVVAIDSRGLNVRRARLLRDHYGIPAERLDVLERDLFELDPEHEGTFDVVAFLGILYHLENPIGAMRLIRSLTRSMCVIESQISRVETPAEVGYVDGQVRNLASSFAVYREPEVDTQLSPVAAMPGVVSLIPNRAAVVEIALAAGFASADVLEPPTDSDPDRRREDRVVVLARC